MSSVTPPSPPVGEPRVAVGDRVLIQCETKLDDGKMLDNEDENGFWVVAGNFSTPMRPLFESLIGMTAGESKAVTISPRAGTNYPLAGRTMYVDVLVLDIKKKK